MNAYCAAQHNIILLFGYHSQNIETQFFLPSKICANCKDESVAYVQFSRYAFTQ